MKILLPLLALILTSSRVFAQATLEDEPVTEIVLSELLAQGGSVMIPLAGLALIAVILITFYFLTIRRGSVVSNRFMNNADGLIRKRDFNGLLNYSHRRSEMVARLTRKSLQFLSDNPNATAGEIREIAEAEGSRQSNLLSQRITWLGDIGAIAPMVGLLGTVIGMIKSFLQISQGSVGVLQQMLAAGVSEALITTATGLVIGITAMVFHSYFKGRVNRLLSEFEAAATHIITLLTTQLNSGAGPVQPQQVMPGTAEGDYHPAHQVIHPQR